MKMSDADAVLIRYGDTMSPAALSFKTEGFYSPEQAAARLAKLLDDPDWLTLVRQDRLITLKMRLIVAELSEQTMTARNAEVLLNGLEKIGARLDKRLAASESDLNRHYAFEGTALLDAVEKALDHMRTALTRGNVAYEEVWDDALATALTYAQVEIAKHDGPVTPEHQNLDVRIISPKPNPS